MKTPAVLAAVILALLIVLSRMPFLDAGYGVNVDAWRVANAARHLATTGEYEVSRFPGYPVQEMVCSLLWRLGPVALNGMSALLSVAAALALWNIARECKCRDAFLLALAMASTPVFFINSVTAKDYVWAIAFVLWAIWAALKDKPLLSGMLLGLAMGCRITSGAMILPLAMVLWSGAGSPKWKALAKFTAVACAVGAGCFLPVWHRYGAAFFTFYENHGRPDLATVIERGTLEVWGGLGIIGLVVVLAMVVQRAVRRSPTELGPDRKLLAPMLVTIALYVVAYWRLPDQAGYLIPIVPATLLLAAFFAPRWATMLLCILLLGSPWISFSKGRLTAGAILQDQRQRLQTLAGVNAFLAFCRENLGSGYVVATGAWEPMIRALSPEEAARFPYLLTAEEAQALLRNGRHLGYASESIREFNVRVNAFDLANVGAVDVHALFLQRRR